MVVMYGIANCDTVKKAKAWLAANEVNYEFIDFKKTPPNEALLQQWLAEVPLSVLLNKRGTTWRNLSDEQKNAAEELHGAITLMTAQPSVIKRPVLQVAEKITVGFQAEIYEGLFR